MFLNGIGYIGVNSVPQCMWVLQNLWKVWGKFVQIFVNAQIYTVILKNAFNQSY